MDSLGDTFVITSSRDTEIRAERKIILRPNSTESGGTGAGGTLDISTSAQFLDSINLYAETVRAVQDLEVGAELRLKNGDYTVGLQAPTLASDISFILPSLDGSSGQVLGTDGAGNLGWYSPSGKESDSFTWTAAEGITKLINHGFDATNVEVFVYDNETNNQILIEEIQIVSSNLVSLTAIEAPPSAGYTVTISEI